MNTELFLKTYNESRNGVNHWVRNPLYRKFLLSDGVYDLAETGCHWLMDILGTELPGVYSQNPDSNFMVIKVKVKDSKASIEGSFTDDTQEYTRKVDYTDLPDGEWVFYVDRVDAVSLICFLPKEY